jgi:apolipoprotein N-acyltransferase
VGYPLLALYLSLASGAYVLLTGTVRATAAPVPAALAAPILWTGLEVLRGELVFSGYPWFLAGHPLIEAPGLAAPATLLGAYAVSFLVVALAGSVADLVGWSASTPRLGRWGAVLTMVVWAVLAFIGTPAKP